MIQRVVLQPLISITGATTQEIRFAVPTSGFKSAQAWINCPKMTYGGGSVNVDILFATSLSLLDPSSGASSFWVRPSGGSIAITASTPGAYVSSVMNGVADFARWRTTTSFATEVQLEIVLFLYDT
jgi:hypothetical protein